MREVARTTRREQILGVAAPLFARHGFHGVSVDDLGAAAGVTGPALYRHFRSKEDILAELLVEVSERLLEGGSSRAATYKDPGTALAELVAFHVDFALGNPDVITVQERELANLAEAARRTVRTLQLRYVAVWADVVVAATGCDRDVAVAGAHAAFGLMNSTPHSARLARPAMVALLRTMALGAIAAAAGLDAAPAGETGIRTGSPSPPARRAGAAQAR